MISRTTFVKVLHWLIAGLLVIWNLMGAMNFGMQFSPEYVASLPPSYQDLIAQRPQWVTLAFGVTVIAGLVGAVLLFVRNPYCLHLLALSAVAALVMLFDLIDPGVLSQLAVSLGALAYAYAVTLAMNQVNNH